MSSKQQKNDDEKLRDKLLISTGKLWQALEYALILKKRGLIWGEPNINESMHDLIAYTTTLVIFYGHIYTRSEGLVTPKKIAKIIDEIIAPFSQEEKALHEKLKSLRHQLYAHSDGAHYSIQKTGPFWTIGQSMTPHLDEKQEPMFLNKEELHTFNGLVNKLDKAINKKIESLNIPEDFLYPSP